MCLSCFSADICFSSQSVPKYYLYYNVFGLYYVFMLAKGTVYETEFAVCCSLQFIVIWYNEYSVFFFCFQHFAIR